MDSRADLDGIRHWKAMITWMDPLARLEVRMTNPRDL
jgi:hypothetical protein